MSWWVTVTAMSALTLWILFRGYQVATGQSRQSAMELVVTALRASLIVGVAMGMVSAAKPNGDESSLYWRATDGLSSAIVKTVTGNSDSPYKEIDKNLALMQVGMTIIDQPAMALDQAQCRPRDSGTCGCDVADGANSQSRQMGYHLVILQCGITGGPRQRRPSVRHEHYHRPSMKPRPRLSEQAPLWRLLCIPRLAPPASGAWRETPAPHRFPSCRIP
ncbi:type IV secretion system protein [Xanthomonas translucens pv. phlei]|uniref:Uncharacterized protein n=2 Tax=Xanthomonas translucens group TaxID=3390202 RepID=A0A0K2ZK21_9XANT|nr:type IV secretion system protein [Xanthomonas translucens pv. phlei]CTP83745.1 hypothetical protein XTPLMG730_0555 [Xanthomonas translucens pv. phlei]